MDQYRPCGEAGRMSDIDRMVTAEEFDRAVQVARRHGLERFDRRDDLFFARFFKGEG